MTHPLDYLSRRWSQARAAVGMKPWLRELSRYCGGVEADRLHAEYATKRAVAAELWSARQRHTAQDYLDYYGESDYWVYRQASHHRHDSWHWILRYMARGRGRMCEYGAGIAPVTTWIAKRRPDWLYTVVEPPTAMLEYARWRLKGTTTTFLTVEPGTLPLNRYYEIITCLDVLEHVPNPLEVVQHLAARLFEGGHLFVNFVRDDSGRENLRESQAQRDTVIHWLNRYLHPVDRKSVV